MVIFLELSQFINVINFRIMTFVMINLALFVSYALYSLPGAFLPIYNQDRGIGSAATGKHKAIICM